jgi:hypothetical protein
MGVIQIRAMGEREGEDWIDCPYCKGVGYEEGVIGFEPHPEIPTTISLVLVDEEGNPLTYLDVINSLEELNRKATGFVIYGLDTCPHCGGFGKIRREY